MPQHLEFEHKRGSGSCNMSKKKAGRKHSYFQKLNPENGPNWIKPFLDLRARPSSNIPCRTNFNASWEQRNIVICQTVVLYGQDLTNVAIEVLEIFGANSSGSDWPGFEYFSFRGYALKYNSSWISGGFSASSDFEFCIL